MADLPDVGSRLPVRGAAPPRPLYDRSHAFGVDRELERIKAGFLPPPRTPRTQRRPSRLSRGLWTSLRRWTATRERGPADLWHRFRCRTGHHELRGGHQMQLGSRFVFVERRCTWCGAQPPL